MAKQAIYHTVKGKPAELGDTDIDGALEVTGASTLTGAVTAAAGITSDTIGEHRHSTQELLASGAITLNSGIVLLNHASTIIAATLDAPTAGDELFIIDSSASGTAAHTVTTAAGVTWDGTNNTATLNAPDESLHVVAISATRWQIIVNNGTVAFSSV
jgi:hypothetical protein